MKIIIILSLIGAALCQPIEDEDLRPEWRYEGGQSRATLGTKYNWGRVLYPGQNSHTSVVKEGSLAGVISFVNPQGTNMVWRFTSHPHLGFEVTQHDTSSDGHRAHSPPKSNFPLLKSTQSIGFVSEDGFDNDQARYIIDDTLVEAAGRESQLAHNLGAVPVAAIHDVRGPPSRIDESKQTGPVLLTEGSPFDQELRTHVLLVPQTV